MSRLVATFFYCGLLRPAPGTWGSAAAVAVAFGLHRLGSFPLHAAATVAVALLGYWATRAETRGKTDHDPSEIVIDEVVGQWLATWPISFAVWQFDPGAANMPWQIVAAAFVLFRFFDIVKIGPVRWADRRRDALGVMLDDIFAGLIAAAILFFAMLWQSRIFDLWEAVTWVLNGMS